MASSALSKGKVSAAELAARARKQERRRATKQEGLSAPVPMPTSIEVTPATALDPAALEAPDTAAPPSAAITQPEPTASQVSAQAQPPSTHSPAPAPKARALAAPFPGGVDDRTLTTFGVPAAVVSMIRQWQAEQSRLGKPVRSVAELAAAAFVDLPLDPQGMLDLVGEYPDEVFDGGREQLSARLPQSVAKVIRQVPHELRAAKIRKPTGWQVLGAAMKRQLDAEMSV